MFPNGRQLSRDRYFKRMSKRLTFWSFPYKNHRAWERGPRSNVQLPARTRPLKIPSNPPPTPVRRFLLCHVRLRFLGFRAVLTSYTLFCNLIWRIRAALALFPPVDGGQYGYEGFTLDYPERLGEPSP